MANWIDTFGKGTLGVGITTFPLLLTNLTAPYVLGQTRALRFDRAYTFLKYIQKSVRPIQWSVVINKNIQKNTGKCFTVDSTKKNL